jgi:hypothetical protein
MNYCNQIPKTGFQSAHFCASQILFKFTYLKGILLLTLEIEAGKDKIKAGDVGSLMAKFSSGSEFS